MSRGKYNLNRTDVELRKDAPIWAKRIFNLIKEKKITQAEFAEKCDITETTVASWLLKDGNKDFPKANFEKLEKVAKQYDVSLEYLLGLYECKKDDEDYMRASHIFGLEEDSMNLLKYLKNKKNSSDYLTDIMADELAVLRPKATLKLINFFVANLEWGDLEPFVAKYSYVKALKELREETSDKHDFIKIVDSIYSTETDPDILRYQIMRIFEKFINECCDKLYHEEITKMIENKKD